MARSKTYAALLRGINVGGRAKIPMRELAELFTALGHENVVTYIQSGNVAFSSPRAPRALAPELEKQIADRFGLTVRVMLRSHAELVQIEARNPFKGVEPAGPRLHVVFLERSPARSAVASLDPGRSPGDAFEVSGREVYCHLPNGAGRSKLSLDYFERTLGVAGSQRNWNTLLKLIALTTPESGG